MTLISRIVGFVRDMVLAQMFGAVAGMDAFYIAFRIPNFMRRLFAEGSFSQAFVPVLADYQKNQPPEVVKDFIAKVSGRLILVLSLVTVIGVLAAPWIITIFAPGFGDGARHVLATELIRVTFPYLMLISLTAMAGAVLNTYGYFGVPAFTPVFLNITMILAALYLSPLMSPTVKGLAYGVLIAGIVQFFFQLPFMAQKGLLVKPKFAKHDVGVTRVMRLMVPALFGVSIAQINLMIDTMFASFLQVGSVSWLYFTDRLTDFPLGVFGVAIATVILPHLSLQHANDDKVKFSKALDWGLRLLLLIGIPSAIGLMIFSMPMIAACFGYGAFKLTDLLQTQCSTITLALGVPAFMMVKVLASGFYAKQDIKTPVKVGVWVMVVNSLLCLVLIQFLAHAGLTLASSLAGYVNCAALLLMLIKRDIYQPQEKWVKFLFQIMIANAVMAIYLFWVLGNVDFWLSLPAYTRFLLLMTHVLVAAGIYALSLGAVGIRVKQFRGQVKGE